ncbi:Gfo/Idh/MocA family oxidoreductase [Bacillus tianshenii]|uniref:Gfo/Idh/MocA family protein n=1 Tax=Sutcliffiella tianshenii TaxID=1463404 RepID=UPI001CD22539|nr:Gfo/Idh/MocA family oxidoreductase [Bacillus tianshenii]MCA1319488.1 Gfo/Idh/MocA family oxidoreductase [Bacillus tianshenii]
MSKIKRVGIVGLGVIGQRLISEFNKSSAIEIAGICDRQVELAKQTSTELNGVPFYTDYKDLIQQDDVDFIYVAVPPAIHHDVVMAAFAQKKHVLCEKPLANSDQEGLNMLNEGQKTGLIHAMHFPLAYQKAFFFMKGLVDEGSLGDIRRIYLKMHFPEWPRPWQQTPWIGKREQGGFIREITPHYLQMILALFGPVKQVTSSVEFPEDETTSELGVIATIELESGLKILVDGLVGQAGKEHISFTIHGTEQSVALDDWRIVKTANKGEDWQQVDLSETNLPHYSLIDEMVKKLDGEDAYLVGFNEGYAVQKVLEKLLEG